MTTVHLLLTGTTCGPKLGITVGCAMLLPLVPYHFFEFGYRQPQG